MAELKTKPTIRSAAEFVATIKDPDQKRDAKALMALLRRTTGEKPVMWGPSIVGFGRHNYKYDSGRSGEWFVTGFSPRKQTMTLYCMAGLARYPDLLAKIGKHKVGVGCLYFKSLDDIHLPTLTKLIRQATKDAKQIGAARRS